MGPLVAPFWLRAIAWPMAVFIAMLNAWLLWQTLTGGSLAPMYTHILVAVEHSPADATILAHAQSLAELVGCR